MLKIVFVVTQDKHLKKQSKLTSKSRPTRIKFRRTKRFSNKHRLSYL